MELALTRPKVPIHDYWLAGYSVDSKRGEIRVRAEWPILEAQPDRPRVSEIVFGGVEAYHFKHDNFGTILGWIVERPLKAFVKSNAGLFDKSWAESGWPHFWWGSTDEAVEYLSEKQARVFELVSTLGLNGWIVARETNAPVTGELLG